MINKQSDAPMTGQRHIVVVWLFALSLTFTLWAAINHNLEAERINALESGHRDAMNFAQVFEEHMERTLLSVDSALLFVKHQYAQVGARTDIPAYVREGLIVIDRLHQIGVIDEKGIYSLSNLQPHKRVDLSDRAHFLAHLERDTGDYFLSVPMLGRATGKWSLQMTRRINKPDGSFGGVVVASVDPYYFTNFYGELHLESRSSITLVGEDGVIRASREGGEAMIGQSIAGSALHQALLSDRSGFLETSTAGGDGKVLFAFRRSNSAPLFVVVGRNLDDVMAGFLVLERRLLQSGAAMTVLILLAAAMSSIFLVRQRMTMMALAENRQRAEAADRAKSKFLSVISHELRTPLNGIIGYAEFLHGDVGDSTQRQFAKVILDSGHALLSLLNSLLSFVDVDRKDLKTNNTLEDPYDIAREVCAMHLEFARDKSIDLVCRDAPGGHREILCDRPKVTEILTSLVHNAVKFTSAGTVSLSVTYSPGYCVFEVADSGPGIDPAMHEVIFEGFQVVGSVETRSQGGLGIGLALARELARLIGGALTLKASDGNGSVFSLSIPFNDT